MSAAYRREHERTREEKFDQSGMDTSGGGGLMASKPWFLQNPSRLLGDRTVGAGHPVYVTGEIGINHNGDLANAIALIDRRSLRRL
jgi:hypothetical protein